jgi:hypothetical protein
MIAFKCIHNGNPYLLFEAAAKPFGIMFVQALPVESCIDAMLDCLPEPWAFGYRQGYVVHVPNFTDHAV